MFLTEDYSVGHVSFYILLRTISISSVVSYYVQMDRAGNPYESSTSSYSTSLIPVCVACSIAKLFFSFLNDRDQKMLVYILDFFFFFIFFLEKYNPSWFA
jgi:hypothetical protein